ncbi:hypothetical protein [Streptomyces sp. NBC_00091]|uniref:hypothetical protein n=1 Tax=Streptomyces sp. NBC_00091 TaxID=2975648 RepID=UPI0022561D2F|nr:hypothetical protein [Streptomyces sp. NBC_00091]MCX5376060.1 hypothetical protein [Streptomyces sp. NBC_00091]
MSETDRFRPRRRRPLRKAMGLLVLLAVIGYFVVQRESSSGAAYCTASATGAGSAGAGTVQTYEMTPEQASNAATIAAVGISKGLPDRAVTIALATAMQESALRNLDHGDRDSLGLFQQRPSQGWGTPEQITDPVYSAGIFYDRLAEIKGYTRLPLTVAAQKVQLSGFPQAYAKHEPDATVLTAAFGENGVPASLACSGPAPAAGDPEKVRAELTRAFGKEAREALVQGGGRAGAPAGRSTAAGPAPEAEVALRLKEGGGAAEARRGRAMAHWAVARSKELGIARVSYDGSSWVAGRDGGRWQGGKGGGRKGGAGDPHDAAPGEVRIFVSRTPR